MRWRLVVTPDAICDRCAFAFMPGDVEIAVKQAMVIAKRRGFPWKTAEVFCKADDGDMWAIDMQGSNWATAQLVG